MKRMATEQGLYSQVISTRRKVITELGNHIDFENDI